MRVLGIDYGTKRVGISISDATGTIANPYITLTNDHRLVEEIIKITNNYQINTIVLGEPKHMNNDQSIIGDKVLELKVTLEENNLNVILVDERRTSSEANRIMRDNNSRKKNRKEKIDALAASIILQTYLDTDYTAN